MTAEVLQWGILKGFIIRKSTSVYQACTRGTTGLSITGIKYNL